MLWLLAHILVAAKESASDVQNYERTAEPNFSKKFENH